MTEQKESPAVVDEQTPAATTAPNPTQSEHEHKATNKGGSRLSVALSAIVIVIALATGGGLYSWNKHQMGTLQTGDTSLNEQINKLRQQQSEQKSALEAIIQDQASQLTNAKNQQAELARQLNDVQQKVATISGSDAKTWLLAQADFLVKLAGRKLWSDQDVTTAAALLKSADASLADMDDPSLITARRALSSDIAALAGITQVDYDGIILQLNQLTNQVDSLRLADNNTDDSPMDQDSNELSSSLTEWRQNLVKSWHNFMDSFITIRRRDETAVPLLAPNQDIYLRENIRARLLVAAQAVPRHQQETYKQSLENVSTWVRAYYDTNDAATRAFLETLDKLGQQSINMDVPESLQSQPIIDKLMQTRVRNLMAQPGVTPAAAPASQPQGE